MFNRNQLSLAIAACVSVQVTVAQDIQERDVAALRGNDFLVEEVIVTARKREESLQTVPVAIDVLSASQLDEKGIAALDGVARYTPGLDFETGLLPNDTRITLRGLSSTRGRSNVAILVDGVDLSSESLTTGGSGNGPNLDLMDLERVEVVKGPQSALYGRSAFAGAVNYVTKRPGDSVESRVAVDANEYGYNKVQAGTSMPIIDGVLGASFSLAKTEFDGYYDNPNTDGDLGAIDSEGLAAALYWTPTESFAAYWRSEYTESNYTQRPIVQRRAIETGAEVGGGQFLLGALGDYAEVRAISDGANCDGVTPYSYKITGSPVECGAILVGDLGSANESEIDLSADPATGRDFAGTEVRGFRTSLELSWDVADLEVLSLTALNLNDSRTQDDFDRADFSLVASQQPIFDPNAPPGPPVIIDWQDVSQFGINANSDTSFDLKQISQEFRVSGSADKLDWQASALYWTESMDAVMNQQWWLRDGGDKDYLESVLADNLPFFLVPYLDLATEPRDLPIPMTRDTDHLSAAFSLNYNLTDTLRLTAEGRYLQEDIDYVSVALDARDNGFLGLPVLDASNPFQPQVIDPEVQTYSRSDSAFVPRVSVDWQAQDNLMVYASIADGFKPGGMTTNDGNGDISFGEYDPEELTVYEAGLKSNLLENRLQLNGSIYLYDYTNQQLSYFFQDMTGQTRTGVTNAGESSLQGMELSAVYRPSVNWTFVASYVFTDSEIEDYTTAELTDGASAGPLDKMWTGTQDGDYAGKEFINSPKDAGLLSIRYDGEFANGATYFTELLGTYESKRYLDRGNNAWLPEYWLVDFQGGVSFDQLDVVFYVNNLLDDDKVKSGLSNVSFALMPAGQVTPHSTDLILPDPRTAGLRLSYNF
ncbi:vitamin B12 transporter BtuB [Microbulbifer aestuariivivens]|uniref:Vitamin B12 transporter BtuB n=1 Tax=Microbulbifer aestuariivivens TaxID=1908308 RepID=A0ABP9WQH6_9GAMM